MENFISSFEQRSTSQKIFIIIGITIVLLFFIGLMFLATNPNQKASTVTSTSPNPSTSINPDKTASNLSNLVSPTPADNNTNYTYAGNHFQTTFSTELFTASGNKDNGEDNIVLQSKNNDGAIYDIYFQITSSNTLPVQNILNVFDYYKLPKTIVQFNGLEATKYSGSITDSKIVSHDTTIIFTKNNFTYKIQLSYQSPTEDPTIQDEFNQILSNTTIY